METATGEGTYLGRALKEQVDKKGKKLLVLGT